MVVIGVVLVVCLAVLIAISKAVIIVVAVEALVGLGGEARVGVGRGHSHWSRRETGEVVGGVVYWEELTLGIVLGIG